MTPSREAMLSMAIDEVRAGWSSVEAELARHPDLAEEAALLRLGVAIQAPEDAVLTPAFRRQTRARLMEEARARSVTKSPLRRILWLKNPFQQRRASMAAILSLVVAVGLALAGGGVYGVQAAVPGDALYPLKAGLEQAEIAWAQGDEALIRTHLGLAERRLDELDTRGGQMTQEAQQNLCADALTHLEAAAQVIERYAAAGHDATDYRARLGADLGRYETWSKQQGLPDIESEQLRGLMPAHEQEMEQHEGEPGPSREPEHDSTPPAGQTPTPVHEPEHDQVQDRDQLHEGDGEHDVAPIGTHEPEHEQWQDGQPRATHEPEMEQHDDVAAPSQEQEHGSTPSDSQAPLPVHEPEPEHQIATPVPDAPAPQHEQETLQEQMHQVQPAPAPTAPPAQEAPQKHEEAPRQHQETSSSGSTSGHQEGSHSDR